MTGELFSKYKPERYPKPWFHKIPQVCLASILEVPQLRLGVELAGRSLGDRIFFFVKDRPLRTVPGLRKISGFPAPGTGCAGDKPLRRGWSPAHPPTKGYFTCGTFFFDTTMCRNSSETIFLISENVCNKILLHLERLYAFSKPSRQRREKIFLMFFLWPRRGQDFFPFVKDRPGVYERNDDDFLRPFLWKRNAKIE